MPVWISLTQNTFWIRENYLKDLKRADVNFSLVVRFFF